MIYKYREHEQFQLTDDPELSSVYKSIIEGSSEPKDIKKLRLLGMNYDFRKKSFSMSYYIGTEWIDKKKDIAIQVMPKISNIDYQRMFMSCFNNKYINQDMDKIFVIHADKTPIKVSRDDFNFEPLLIIYYLNLVSAIVNTGLRKDYTFKEETLNKIKGKILVSSYISHCLTQKRKDRVPCRYQEYDVDCLDNRVLKAALLICKKMIDRNMEALGTHHHTKLYSIINKCLSAFANVSENVTQRDLNSLHVNPLFMHYKAALPIAKMIIKKQGYCVSRHENDEEQSIPPFAIDMSLLFERYVYGLLHERYGDEVGFQVSSNGNKMDFCLSREHLVIDTKYIPKWDDTVNHKNVRQLSGYARNIPIRRKLGLDRNDDTTICPCLIIYPAADGLTDLMGISDSLFNDPNLENVKDYIKFKKLGIRLPMEN